MNMRGAREDNVLGGKGLVVHEEHVHVVDVVDEEGLVAGGHHVAGALVGTIADLEENPCQPFCSLREFSSRKRSFQCRSSSLRVHLLFFHESHILAQLPRALLSKCRVPWA